MGYVEIMGQSTSKNLMAKIVQSQLDSDKKKFCIEILKNSPEISEQEFLEKISQSAWDQFKNGLYLIAYGSFMLLGDLLTLDLQPGNSNKINKAQTYYGIAACFQGMKNYEVALKYSLMSFIFEHANPHAPLLAADCLIQLKDVKHAKESLELALSIAKDKELLMDIQERLENLSRR